jgi:hypothetical protein
MKQSIIALALSAALATSSAYAADDTEQRLAESRATIKAFGMKLKGELQAAMKAGGPVNAIKVCNQVAPAIASDISMEKGWDVARTSLKTRNSANNPDAWETKVMESFEKRKAAGEPAGKLEFSEIVEVGGNKSFRYMKAIPTGEVCLKCHGTTIDPKIATKLDSLYPDDQARGFNKGDIRGAFTITQPM